MATVTTTGLNKIVDTAKTNFAYLAVGSGTPTSTALGNELDRNAATVSIVDNVMYVESLFSNAEANNAALSEWGVFTASTGGYLLVYGAESPTVNKDSSSGLFVSVTVTLDNA